MHFILRLTFGPTELLHKRYSNQNAENSTSIPASEKKVKLESEDAVDGDKSDNEVNYWTLDVDN